ncbi:MAG: hypothetical protein JRH20_07070 [Deltaproteobacteria bacterium]|nr:hypothetical protein [Deltaproteobacteria bacterium]
MWDTYLRISTEHAFIAAFIQFLLLGSVGEILATMLRTGSRSFPFSPLKLIFKALGWGGLGLYIKVMFLMVTMGVAGLVAAGYLPQAVGTAGSFFSALTISVLLNAMFGPSMMLAHRLTDNAIDRLLDGSKPSFAGLDRSLWTLIWLWIPLHTFTFTQAKELRIGIAALLSLLLGVVMGAFGRRASATS